MNKEGIIQIGVIVFLILVGVLMKLNPPKSINGIYGYRTQRSMKSQAAWEEGNRFAAKLIIVLGVIWGMIQLLAIYIMKNDFKFLTPFFIVCLLTVSVSLILITEHHLKKLFD